MKLSTIADTLAREYAMYTIEQRALPHLIDGFKPVHRFCVYSTINNAKNDYNKVAAVGGRVSEYGYHHGEESAAKALALLANDWTNNINIIDGRGNFGSRMVQERAAARYIYCKLSDNFEIYYPDSDIAPAHKDAEHLPPAFYVPSIPMVLVNGIKGIATGFACNIMPHDPTWLVEASREVVNGKKISTKPVIKFPEYNGNIEVDHANQKYTQVGSYTVSGLTVDITDIPLIWDHEKYIALLKQLVRDNKISSFEDNTKKEFSFKIKFRRGTKMTPELIERVLKLRHPNTQNINVIDYNGKLRTYKDAESLIEDFVAFRLDFLNKRIQNELEKNHQKLRLMVAKVRFIKQIINDEFQLKNITRKVAISMLRESHGYDDDLIPTLLNMRMDQMTTDELAKLEDDANKCQKLVDYWKNTTSKKEYLKDLKNLKEIL